MRTECRRCPLGEQYLTLEEIETKYPNEWVLIDRRRVDKCNGVLGGKVVWHHPDRDEFDRRLPEHPLGDSAILFAGQLHPETYNGVSIWIDDFFPDETPSS